MNIKNYPLNLIIYKLVWKLLVPIIRAFLERNVLIWRNRIQVFRNLKIFQKFWMFIGGSINFVRRFKCKIKILRPDMLSWKKNLMKLKEKSRIFRSRRPIIVSFLPLCSKYKNLKARIVVRRTKMKIKPKSSNKESFRSLKIKLKQLLLLVKMNKNFNKNNHKLRNSTLR